MNANRLNGTRPLPTNHDSHFNGIDLKPCPYCQALNLFRVTEGIATIVIREQQRQPVSVLHQQKQPTQQKSIFFEVESCTRLCDYMATKV